MAGNRVLPRRVAIAYDESALFGDAASRDVIEQMEAVETVLVQEGIECVRLGVDLDLAAFKERIARIEPDVVFNLVESLDGSDQLQTLAPMALESWGTPFTGCGSLAMALSNDKQRSKELLAANALPTPGSVHLDDAGRLLFFPEKRATADRDYIVKAVSFHASVHMDDFSVLRRPGPDSLGRALADARERHGIAFFAEEFIDGREFNLSLLERPGGSPQVLPPAEILFDRLPEGKPRIVGYAAKWREDSPEYRGTPRTFDFPPDDAPLLARLRGLAVGAWLALGLSGYARVDFRVDAAGNPFILEANTNPCLNPDAGLAAAVERAGRDFRWLVMRVLGSPEC